MAGEAWIETTIGEQATLQRGIDITKAEQRDGKVPVISSGGVSSYHDTAAVKGPGVVLGRKGVVGSVYFIEEDYWPHDTSLWVKDFHGNYPRFVYYFFKSVAPQIARMDVGSANPTLNRNHVHPMPIVWPPLAEQKAIAAVLGALDDKIELNRRMNATLEAMARALFQSWFVDFDPVRANMDRRDRWTERSEVNRDGRPPAALDPATAALFPEHIDRSEDFPRPQGWKISRLGDHVELVRGNTYKSKLKDLPGPYLFGLGSIHRNGGFRDDSLRTYGGESAPKIILRPGDLFASLKDVTQAADLLGAVARVPVEITAGRLTQDTVKLIPRNTGISFAYLYRTLLLPEYREYCRGRATGTTNLGLSREDFLDYPVLVPPQGIQDAFDAFDSQIEAKIANNRIQSRTLATLRDTLLPKLLSGEIGIGEITAAV
jgi:type I restriction enzyme S subunit